MIIPVSLLEKQEKFLFSPKKFIMYSGGRRSGKSMALAYAAFRDACIPKNKVLVIRKTLSNLRTTTLDSLIGIDNPAIPPEAIEDHNKTQGIIKIKGGGTIQYRGLDKGTSVRSSEFGCICIDEAIEFTEEEFEDIVYCLSGRQGCRKVYMATNPGAPDKNSWIYRKFFIEKNEDCEVITSSSYDNHHNPADFFKMFDNMDPDRKKRMVEGKWVAIEGTVWSNFNRGKHVKTLEKEQYSQYYFAIDWGQTHPCAMLLVGVEDGVVYVLSEFVKKDMLIDEMRSIIQKVHLKYDNLCLLYDPSAKILANDLANIGITLKMANKDVVVGIDRVRTRFGNNRITINSSCENLIREIENYQYKPGTEEVKKVNDDLADCLRYIINEVDDSVGTYIYPNVMENIEEVFNNESLWEDVNYL